MGLAAGARPARPLSPTSLQSCVSAPRLEITLFHLGRLISADEILRFHPSYVPKMPVCPLMAFYMGHINLSLSPPRGTALILAPIHPHAICNWLMSSRRGAAGQRGVLRLMSPLVCGHAGKARRCLVFNSRRVGEETLIMYLAGGGRLWPSGPMLLRSYVINYCLFTAVGL